MNEKYNTATFFSPRGKKIQNHFFLDQIVDQVYFVAGLLKLRTSLKGWYAAAGPASIDFRTPGVKEKKGRGAEKEQG